MAITTNELNIANTSYTNKDFEAIYTELLDLATKISDKFDPTSSNESDPFIMLLKLLAFVGDKINYNIDKNILERFLLSATQEKSVRELTDMLGYHMHYYVAPETNVVFTYDEPIPQTLTLEGLTTVILNDTNDIQYILKQTGSIDKGNIQSKVLPVIQGTLHTFTVLDNTTITLDNLDGNYRLYFPELMVAQNGVFIEGGSIAPVADKEAETAWTLVNNLNTRVYNSRCYAFGFDSKQNLPYIQFPEWISNIIGEGLTIQYITTTGENGNVKARTLINYTLPDTYLTGDNKLDQAKIHVKNTNAALNGLNPETINEAINGYKKTVGTFETLVACRDYANYIYNNLYDDDNNHIVSNIQVSDRRNDINYAWNVLSYTELGEQIKSVIKTTDETPEISAYDLTLYPFCKVGDTSYNANTTTTNYKKSFTKSSPQDLSYIKNKLEYDTTSCLSHNYKTLKNTDIYAIKNYYSIGAIISTYNKVTSTEQAAILENINIKLTKTYNARNVDFGYGLDRDALRETIQNADSRIKYVDLTTIDIESKALINDNTEQPIYNVTDITNTNKWFQVVISKNVLSGKISAFDYYNTFEINYNEKDAMDSTTSPYDVETLPGKITKVTTYANIGNANITEGDIRTGIQNFNLSTDPGKTYTLQQNEVLQFIAPNYVVDDNIYPYGTNYTLVLNPGKTTIPKNQQYVLQSGEYIIFEWQDSTSKQNIGKKYITGNIISSKNDLYTTAEKIRLGGKPLSKTFLIEGETTETTEDMFMLQTTDEVTPLKLNQQTFKGNYKVYWYLDNTDNKIQWDNNSYILQDNEYFYIADNELINFYPFGSGTKIVRGNANILNEKLDKITDITLITEEGLESIQSYFKAYKFNEGDITFIEQEIITLTENTEIKILPMSGKSETSPLLVPNNTFNTIDTTIDILYKLPQTGENNWVTITNKATLPDTAQWMCRGVLDINVGPELEQPLLYKALQDDLDIYKHEIEIWILGQETPKRIKGAKSTGTGTDIWNNAFKLSALVQKLGGKEISLNLLDVETGSITYPELYYYASKQNKENLKIANNDFNYYNIEIEKGNNILLNVPSKFTEDMLLMIYVDSETTKSDLGIFKVDFDYISGAGKEDVKLVVENDGFQLNKGIHILKVIKKTSGERIGKILFENISKTTNISFVLSKPRLVKGINPDLGYRSNSITTITAFINNVLGSTTEIYGNPDALKIANLLNFTDNSRKITTSKFVKLNDAEAFWDFNNIANKWTIPQLDIENSAIIISPSSKK